MINSDSRIRPIPRFTAQSLPVDGRVRWLQRWFLEALALWSPVPCTDPCPVILKGDLFGSW